MTPSCHGPMKPRETLTHGQCWVCPVCGMWQAGAGKVIEDNPAYIWVSFAGIPLPPPAPPEALHHRQPSEN